MVATHLEGTCADPAHIGDCPVCLEVSQEFDTAADTRNRGERAIKVLQALVFARQCGLDPSPKQWAEAHAIVAEEAGA